jgi:uncharacterized DUF497 family protein
MCGRRDCPFRGAARTPSHAAISVFDDHRAAVDDDPDPNEERFRIVDMTALGLLLVVVYAERGADTIRIIIGQEGQEA